MGCILQNAHTFIGQVEKDHCSPKDTAVSDYVVVHHLGDSDQEEDDDLPADTTKAHLTGKLLVGNRTHDAGNIVRYDKYQKGEQKAITAAQKVPEPSAGYRKNKLTQIPKFFHNRYLSFYYMNIGAR